MEPYRQQIEELTIEELLGKLTPDNRLLLNSLLEEHPDGSDIQSEVRAVFTTDAGQRALHRPEQPVEDVFEYGRRKQQRARVRRLVMYGAAAALLLGIIRIYPYFNFSSGSRSSHTPAPVAANVDPHHIKLALANGQTVDLSSSGPQVQVNNMTVHNQQQTLSFSDVPADAQWATLTVPIGKDYKLNLPDGSEVWLNSATKIHFPLRFTGNTREIDIDGEAYVKVVPQAGKPFMVHLPHSTVNVLGTEFNINTYDSGQTRLALVKGAVNLALPNKTLTVQPGFQLTVSDTKGESNERFDPRVVLGWREGICIYQDASLEDLGHILNRWFGVDVVLDNPGVSSMRFNGMLRRTDTLETYLTNLEYTNGPAFYIKDKVVHFK